MRGARPMACVLRCISQTTAWLQSLRVELDSFHMVCIITVSANQILLQAKVRQRYSDDIFCRRATLWSVRLVRGV